MSSPTASLKKVINAWGTPTLYGVSKAPDEVIQAVSKALGDLYHMPSLIQVAGQVLADFSGAPWGCVTHCSASAITLACAAAMTGRDRQRIAQLPNTQGMKDRIVIGAGHRVNYGVPIAQAIALSGATEVIVGDEQGCDLHTLKDALAYPQVAAMVYVVSHLARPGLPPLSEVIDLGGQLGVPILVDAAAQDLRMQELVALGPDLILFSGQKYLRAPTAGIVLGRRDLVEALDMHHAGIGRGMKPTKEAIVGVLAAIQVRQREGLAEWARIREQRVTELAARLEAIAGLDVCLVPDPTGNPFQRVRITPNPQSALDAPALARVLANGDPIIATGAHYAHLGYLNLEPLELSPEEMDILVETLTRLTAG